MHRYYCFSRAIIYCRWIENGALVENFMEILPLIKADAQSIYSVLIERLGKHDVQYHKLGWVLMVQQHLQEREPTCKHF